MNAFEDDAGRIVVDVLRYGDMVVDGAEALSGGSRPALTRLTIDPPTGRPTETRLDDRLTWRAGRCCGARSASSAAWCPRAACPARRRHAGSSPLVAEFGQPVEPPHPLEPISEDDVGAVCWMAALGAP